MACNGSAGRGSPCAQAMAQTTRTDPARDVTRSFSPDGLVESEGPSGKANAGTECLGERLEQQGPVLLQLRLSDPLHPPEIREGARSREHHLPQRSVVEDDEGGQSLLLGDPLPQGSQRLEGLRLVARQRGRRALAVPIPGARSRGLRRVLAQPHLLLLPQ